MTEKLKPCPWCNSNFYIECEKQETGLIYYAECMSCACRGPWKNSHDEALVEWNKRPGPCDRCEQLDKYIATKIDENHYKCGLWMAERIKSELKKEMQWFKEHKSDVGISIGFQAFVLKVIEKTVEEERQRQESKK